MATHRHGRDAPQEVRDHFLKTVRAYLIWVGDHEIGANLEIDGQIALYEAARRVWNCADPVPEPIFEGLLQAGLAPRHPTMTCCAQALGRKFKPPAECISKLQPLPRPLTPSGRAADIAPETSLVKPPKPPSQVSDRFAERGFMNDLTDVAHLTQKLGISQYQAAFRCGISIAAFRWLVEQGLMPKPKNVRKRLVWLRSAVDEAFIAYMNDEQHE